MKKIILGLFIILFCFSIGIAQLQEEELSKEEKVKAELDIKIERYLKLLNRSRLEKLSKEELIIEILDLKEFIKLDQLTIKLLEELVEMDEEEREEEKENEFAWMDKIPDVTKKDEQKKELSYWDGYEAAAVDYFKSLGVWKKDPEKLEEENDRLEDLLRELRNEKSELEWDMMRYKSDLEWHMLELSSRLEFDLLFNPLLTFPFDYRYTYPGYSTQQTQRDWTNYDTTKFLFKLHRLSKGKMDWSKSWQLRLLLNNK